MHTTHFIANGDIHTAYHEVGSGAPFVMIHGFTGSKLDFHDQLEWFEDLRRVIVYDQRGHGESSNLAPYDMAQLELDLIGFLDEIGVTRCDLLGHSLGGMVALRAVLAHPGRFRSLILMDTSAEPMDLIPQPVREQLNELVIAQGCEALLELMRGQPANPAQQLGVDYLGEAEHWRRIGVKLSQMDPEAFVALGEALGNASGLTDRLSAISCSTTVLVGERDAPFVASSRNLAGAIPEAQLTTIRHAGHSPQYENPDAWRDAVREHLGE